MSTPAARGPIVTIDGPAGSGKTTVGRLLADSLGFLCLDSGLFYRAVALATVRDGGDSNSTSDALHAANALRLRFEADPSGGFATRVYDGGREITEALVSRDVERSVSLVSRIPEVRAAMLVPQRQALRDGNVVALGRDIGTVVAPDAEVKVYLEATLDTRTRRRWSEQRQRGQRVDIPEVREGLIERDRIDSQREVAPLEAAPDAVTITTDDRTPEDIVNAIRGLMAERGFIDEA